MNIIKTEELIKKLESGPLALFDVRGDVEFEKNHIPGSKSAPAGSLTFRVADVMNPDSLIVVYSEDEDSKLAADAAQRLEKLGLKNVHVYAEGIKGWQKAGQSTVSSENAKIHTHGPVAESRPIIVDRERSYGGAFKNKPSDGEGAGG
jgi:rhodanese-related sulfurtransferase